MAGLFLGLASVAPAADVVVDPRVEATEERRIAAVQKITPATIAVFDREGGGGGSGVIVSEDGFAVTNFHVVAPCGALMKCGLADGRLVDAVMVGIDPPGDVAVIKLIGDPNNPKPWPVAEWGDSDRVSVGDEAIVAGNPFLLANDFQPTVTFGIISGTHRYQYPAGTLLEYADCLQTDAAINPGNSGGPLYSGTGALIGINGRGSFEKRGRVNVGVGYAISSNQVKRFLSHLKSGRIVDHASLGATFRTSAGNRVVVQQIREDCDAYRRGLRYGDEILRFAGREIKTANALQNALGTYPPGWRAPLTFRRGFVTRDVVVKLGRLHGAAQLEELVRGQLRGEDAKPQADDAAKAKAGAEKYFEFRPGFANYYFNKQARDNLLKASPQVDERLGEQPGLVISAQELGGGKAEFLFTDQRVEMVSPRGRFWIDANELLHNQLSPPGSGGLLAALHLWRVVVGAKKPPGLLEYVGLLPWGEERRLCECMKLRQGGAVAEFYFDAQTRDLVGLEYIHDDSLDPCVLRFKDFTASPGDAQPERLMVLKGDTPWLELTDLRYSPLPPGTDASGKQGEIEK